MYILGHAGIKNRASMNVKGVIEQGGKSFAFVYKAYGVGRCSKRFSHDSSHKLSPRLPAFESYKNAM